MIAKVHCVSDRIQGGVLRPTPGLNLLVGPNGSGKSTVIKAIHNYNGRHKVPGVTVTASPCQTLFFDMELNNPRTQSHFGSNVGFQVNALFMSHGQSTKEIVRMLAQVKPGQVVLLDEPETAMDVDALVAMRETLVKAAGVAQLLVATHTPVLLTAPGANHLVLGDPDYVDRALQAYRAWL